MKKYRSRKKGSFGEDLTKGEALVFEKALTGLCRKDIARKLFVTDRTVAFHLTNIYKKFGVKNRGELILKNYKEERKDLVLSGAEEILPSGGKCYACGK